MSANRKFYFFEKYVDWKEMVWNNDTKFSVEAKVRLVIVVPHTAQPSDFFKVPLKPMILSGL